MINSKITKAANQQTNEDRLFKLLESMDWKLWEMMNMLKDNLPTKEKATTKPLKAVKKAAE
jgi:succinate dehydrogenase flavin-adding protein (antitoxin of CptAB toxin-antitoxin module)